jgi:hypothetical protein
LFPEGGLAAETPCLKKIFRQGKQMSNNSLSQKLAKDVSADRGPKTAFILRSEKIIVTMAGGTFYVGTLDFLPVAN